MTVSRLPKPPKRPIHGVLLLDKPLGMSSNKALQTTRWHYHAEKAGHTGVLDPLATGLLPVCLGEATKFSAHLLDADKGYTATVRFGHYSSTGDLEGEFTPGERPIDFDQAGLLAAMASLIGPIEQVPPMYSALKHQGRSLYEYARQGVEIERKPRQVVIHRLELLSFDGQDAVLDVQCSKGTYVRTLAADLGAKLGCGAHLAGLRRTRTAGFDIADAIALDALVEMTPEARMAMLLPVDILVNHLPIHTLNDAETHKICHGQPVHVAEKDAIIQGCRLYDSQQRFVGIGRMRADGLLWPDRLLAFSPAA